MTDMPDAPPTIGSEPEANTRGSASPLDEEADFDSLDEQEDESFPASDPHSDWAGPPEEVERP